MVAGSPAGPLVEVKHGGIFFVPPYDPEGVAATLTPKQPKKPKTGRLAVNKVVRDPNDLNRRFERAGFTFEVRDSASVTVPGSHFTTASNGRGVCPVELPLDESYVLVETSSPQPNVTLVQQPFTIDRPNLLLRVENIFQVPPPGYGVIA